MKNCSELVQLLNWIDDNNYELKWSCQIQFPSPIIMLMFTATARRSHPELFICCFYYFVFLCFCLLLFFCWHPVVQLPNHHANVYCFSWCKGMRPSSPGKYRNFHCHCFSFWPSVQLHDAKVTNVKKWPQRISIFLERLRGPLHGSSTAATATMARPPGIPK